MTPQVENRAGMDDTIVLDGKSKRNILIATCVALMAVMASVSGLNVAQADIAVDLGISQSMILWIINGYTLALAALLLPIGAIGDRWGRKPVLMAGLVVVLIASIAAGVAPTGVFMLIARIAAGVGAAMIMPVTLSVVTSSFPEDERGRAIGIWAGVAGGGSLVGLVVASLMVDMFTWRWLFAMPVVLAVVALAVSWKSVPNSREHSEHPFDVIGSIASFLAIGGLVLGIHEGPERGWTDPLAMAGIAIGIVALVVFIMWELRAKEPLFDIRTLSDRNMASGAVTLLLLFGVMFGIFLVLFPFLQAVLGYSALKSAVSMLPMALIMMPLSAMVPMLSAKIGTRPTLLMGITGVGVGLVMLAVMTSADGGYLSVLPGLLVIGLGMGLSMTPSTEAITASLPEEKQGVASALNDTVRELGGAVGIALLGSVMNAGYRSSVAGVTEGLPSEAAHAVKEGIGGALVVAGQIGGETGATVAHAAKVAVVDGWVNSMWVGVAVIAVGWLFVALARPRRSDAPADVGLVERTPDQDAFVGG